MIRKLALATAFVFAASAAQAADVYKLEPGHTQVLFQYNHMGFSNITGSFTKVEGEINLDTADLAKSSVKATISIDSVSTGVAKLDEHLKSGDFFDAPKFANATFASKKVEKAGEKALKVSGDLTIHGVTKPVTFDVTVNAIGEHPMAKKPAAGFDATAKIKRSDFGISKYVPNVSDDVTIRITTEAVKG